MHEPWASLVIEGRKRVETRPRPTPRTMKGRVAVHANRTNAWLHLCHQAPFDRYLLNRTFKLGHIIGTVEIVRSVTLTESVADWTRTNRPEEYAFGDYTPGRFGWVLRNPIKLIEPVEFSAHQGWPDVDDNLIPEYAR